MTEGRTGRQKDGWRERQREDFRPQEVREPAEVGMTHKMRFSNM